MSRSTGYTASMFLFMVLVVFSASGFLGMRPPRVAVAEAPLANHESFAVVELFTSEGCSSCPPADVLLGELVKRQAKGEAIYALGYHVDYWNRLGWKDRFTLSGSTQHQSQYAERLGLDQIYTPQAIVNGTTEFVGSNRQKLNAAVTAALETPVTQSLSMSIQDEGGLKSGQRLAVKYDVSRQSMKDSTKEELRVAVVQRSGTSVVKNGENAGRTLVHAGIVRSIKATPLIDSASGTVTVELPTGVQTSELDIVGFVQNTDSGEIVAADLVRLAQ